MKKFLVIGNPIKHSLSPKLHNYWFRKNNIEANYSKISPENNEIENIISDIKEKKIYGMNVTVPYKQSVIPHLEILSPIAKKTNSVNTVFNKNTMVGEDLTVGGKITATGNVNTNGSLISNVVTSPCIY